MVTASAIASASASASASSSSSAAPILMGWDGDEKPHVLAVDDSFVDRRIIEKLLTNSACKVTTAENAHGALELLGLADGQQNFGNTVSKVNLIITDYSMPGMTGYELLKRLRCLEEGAKEFLLKPLRQSDVNQLRCHLMKLGNPSDEGMVCMGR